MEETKNREEIINQDYETFKESATDLIKEALGLGYQIISQIVKKNNGQELDALIIREEGSNIAPTIYVQNLYQEYQHGEEMEDIINRAVSVVNFKKPEIPLFNRETAEQNLYAVVCNYAANKEMLKDMPHRQFLDLAVYPKFRVASGEFGQAAIKVNNALLEQMKLTKDEALNIAIKNTEQEGFELKPIMEVLREKMDIPDEMFPTDTLRLYVVSTPKNMDGSAVLASKNELAKAVEKIGEDCFILPSSIHEVLLLPVSHARSVDEMEAVVREVNENELKPEEILSNTVYHFGAKTKKLTMAYEALEEKKTETESQKKTKAMKM